jgi:hypothetical protein
LQNCLFILSNLSTIWEIMRTILFYIVFLMLLLKDSLRLFVWFRWMRFIRLFFYYWMIIETNYTSLKSRVFFSQTRNFAILASFTNLRPFPFQKWFYQWLSFILSFIFWYISIIVKECLIRLECLFFLNAVIRYCS